MLKAKLVTQHITSLEDAKEYIYGIDFSKVIKKLVKYSGWLENDAEQTCKLYRNFLFLNKKYLNTSFTISPSEDIDEFWHSHILDTEAYIRDCNIIFGRYFHHYPYFGIDEKSTFEDVDQAFEITQQLHFQEFGEYITPTKSGYPKFFYFLMKKIPILNVT